MQYTRPTFTLPVNNSAISQREYEIRVGTRCPKCEYRLPEHDECCPDYECCGHEGCGFDCGCECS